MDKIITADMLDGMGHVIKTAFAALYPVGLPVSEIERLSHARRWMARIYSYLKREGIV